jgi:hypothetical protein
MKVVTLHKRIKTDELFDLIQKQLNPLFHEQRKTDLDFTTTRSADTIEITQPNLYPGDVLYHIEIRGDKLLIRRNEHYVDDVNSLTVESILNDLFKTVAGKSGTDLILEG